jgi:hypothetical protein
MLIPCLVRKQTTKRNDGRIWSSADDIDYATGRNYTGRQNVCPGRLGVLVAYYYNGHNAIMCNYCRVNRGTVN